MAGFTKKAILESFSHLLEQKPFDKITVKDIVEDCGINRGTFYYYYSDMYALIEDAFKSEVQRVIGEEFRSDTWQEDFLLATQLAKEEKRRLYHAFNSISRINLEKYLYRIAKDMMDKFVEHQAEGINATSESKEFISRFYACALVGLITLWLDDGMKEDPEKYINKMGHLFEGNIKTALQKGL